jgi:uncharacterized membrane protein YkvA (DUF1232 family)
MATKFEPNWNVVYSLFKNKATRWIAIVLVAIYVISPFDFVPDLIPFVGILDDATIIGILIFIYRKVYQKKP